MNGKITKRIRVKVKSLYSNEVERERQFKKLKNIWEASPHNQKPNLKVNIGE